MIHPQNPERRLKKKISLRFNLNEFASGKHIYVMIISNQINKIYKEQSTVRIKKKKIWHLQGYVINFISLVYNHLI